nr:NlpC/P60 family protein [Alkalilacustris brevis]
MPFNGHVAHVSLRGRVEAGRFVEGLRMRIAPALIDLNLEPKGPRARQLLMGQAFVMLELRGDHAFGQAEHDGHVGWLPMAALDDWADPTHRVGAPATHLYTAPDLKAPEAASLSLGARLTIKASDKAKSRQAGKTALGGGAAVPFLATDCGHFVPAQHVLPLHQPAQDPVAVAESLLGTPYLWGGNSRWGIDCSGLVQAGCLACAIPCPPDSDLQQALGQPLVQEAPLKRGDLVFWKGHVGWMLDGARLLHANAHHMAVAIEPLAEARARIKAAGGGDIIAWRRLDR